MSGKSSDTVRVGNEVEINIISEWENNKRMDTHLKIGTQSLCWVSGAKYDEFITKLQNLVNEYRI